MAPECSLFFLVLIFVHNAHSNPTNHSELVPPISALDEHEANPYDFPVDNGGSRIDCQTDDDCTKSVLGVESHCIGTHCQCKDKASQSPTSKKCLIERSTLGSGCEENWQCTRQLGADTECRDYICSCTQHASVVNGRCWKQIVIGDQCDHDEQCVGGQDTVCTDGVCACKAGMVSHPDNTKCLPVASGIGGQCVESIQCSAEIVDGVSCQNGICKCMTDYHEKNKGCVKTLGLGDQCSKGEGECFLADSFGIDRVECQNTCQCKSSFHPSKDNKFCVVQGQPDPESPGGAAGIYPFFTTIVMVMSARLLAS